MSEGGRGRRSEKIRRFSQYHHGLTFTEADLAYDAELWNRNMRKIMPSNDAMDACIERLPPYKLSDHLTQEQIQSLTARGETSMRALSFLGETSRTSWFTLNTARFLYEILIAEYLPLVGCKERIDLKVAMDDGLEAVGDLDKYVGNWVKYISLEDTVFSNVAYASRTPIVRRAWIMTYTAEVENEVSGHQILVVAERRRVRPSEVFIFVVDNVPSMMYNDFTPLGIEISLRKHFALHMPGLEVVEVDNILNSLPTDGEMGSCVSVSFRALMLFSFLSDPFTYLITGSNTHAEGDRFLKLMYLHLCRMRHSLLTNRTIWHSPEQKTLTATYLKSNYPGTVPQNLHNISKVGVWIFTKRLTRGGISIKEGGSDKILTFDEFLSRMTMVFDKTDSSDEAGNADLRWVRRIVSPHVARLYFNPDLRAEGFQETPPKTKASGDTCIVSAHFTPQNWL